MNPVARKVMATGNKTASWLYARSNGKIGGSARGVPVLLLTVPGRKTGKPHTVPVAYFDHEGEYLVAASAGGAKANPQWIHNLEAAGGAHLNVAGVEVDVDARIANPEERAELWQNVVVARAPSFANYEEKSGRLIPIGVLTPRS